MPELRRLRVLAWLTPAALLFACGDDADTFEPQVIQTQVALTQLSTCDAVERHIEDRFIEDARRQVEQIKGDEWFFGGGPGWAEDDLDVGAPVPTQGAGNGGSGNEGAPRSPQDFTDTNTQEAGVDEADFVKTNGVRTFVLTGGQLYAAQTWPPTDLTLEDSMAIEGHPMEMFLTEDDQLVVFSSDYLPIKEPVEPGGPDIARPIADDCFDCWGYGVGQTRMTVIDGSGATLRKLYEITLPGSYTTSRRVGDAVRVVMSETIMQPRVQYWPEIDYDVERQRNRFHDDLDRMLEENIRAIRAASLTDFLPQAARVDVEGNEVILERDCARFHAPNTPVRIGLTTVATLDVDAGTVHRTSVFGEGHQVYASEDTLYMSSNHWWWSTRPGQSSHTYVHAFDLQSRFARYRGSFGVPGTLNNQFSMDEHAGHIRLATTVDTFEEVRQGGAVWVEPERSNRLTIFSKDTFGFTETGSVEGLARNEQIFSARMEGDRGFIVTFERIDPLFTFDLSDPMNPKVVGELKVPGFSTYIHFLGENHLLTIGEHVPDPAFPNAPQQWGLKLTIFDVSDFANPKESHVEYLTDGSSDASWDHKAFNFFPAKKALAIPMSRWGGRYDQFISELQLFEVDAFRGIKKLGAIDMTTLYPTNEDWYGYYSPYVRRSIMADDYAYAISDAGIRVAPIATPSQTVGTLLFR